MSEDTNVNMSQIMLNKLSQRQDYFAWYLSQYKINENHNTEQMINFLQTSEKDIERLSMCRVPNSKAFDFMQKIKVIANFTNVDSFKLIMVIRKVESILALRNNSTAATQMLLAAREKKDQQTEDN